MSLPEPRDEDARIERIWRGVERKLDEAPRRQRRTRTIAVASGVLALAAAAFLVWSVGRPATSVTQREASAASAVVLADASRILPSPGAEYVLRTATAERVEIDLSSGEVDFDVTPAAGRVFIVNAAGHEVSVLGTRFRVRAAQGVASALFVGVERGRVRVRGPNVDHVLGAGESWTADFSKTAALPPEATPAAIDPSPPSSVANAGAARSPGEPSAKDLFQRALDARRAGRDREAAAGFDHVRRFYRSDLRAGLAAYELGRIRLDALHEPAGAAEAFADAIALAPLAPFREDAEARRVDALDAAGDRARCEEARAAYLARFPNGLHGNRLAQRCRAR